MEGLVKVDFITGALPYAEQLGWKVLLLAPRWKVPYCPKGSGGSGVHDATTNVGQLREWGKVCPHGNIGIACGAASGTVVIDVDPRNGGDESLAALAAKPDRLARLSHSRRKRSACHGRVTLAAERPS